MVSTYLETITMQKSCAEKNGAQIEGHVEDRIGTSLQDASGKQRLSHELWNRQVTKLLSFIHREKCQ